MDTQRQIRVLLLLVVAAAALSTRAAAQTERTCPAGCQPGYEGKMVLTGPPKKRVNVLRCTKCSSGQFVNATTNCCQRCRGTILNGVCVARLSCPDNAETKPDPVTGAAACLCKPGYQATAAPTATGAPGCSACPAGTANKDFTTSTTACTQCPDGFAAPRAGLKECLKCFNGSASTADATSCLCPVGSFFVRPSNTTTGRRLHAHQHQHGIRRLLKDGSDDKGPKKNETKPGGDDKNKNSTRPGDDRNGTRPGDDNGTRPGDDRNGTRPGDDNGTRPGDDRNGTRPGDDRNGTRPGDDNGTRPGDDNGTRPGDDRNGTHPGDDRNGTRPGDDRNGTRPGDDNGLGGGNSTRPGDDNNSTRPGGGRGVDDPFKNDDRLFQLGSCTPCPNAGDNPSPSLWSGCCTAPLVWDGTACV